MILTSRMQGMAGWENWGQDLFKSAVVGVAQGAVSKLTGGSSSAPAPNLAPAPHPGMSTGAKIALGVGGVALVAVLLKALRRKR